MKKLLAVSLLVLVFFVQVVVPGRYLFFFPYASIIRSEAAVHGISPALVAAVIRVESGFRSQVVSRRGARGLMQVMPDTARYIMEKSGHQDFDDLEERLLDPQFNVQIGVGYLDYLLTRYDGDMVLVLAAYNAGPGKVDWWLKENIWDGTLANSHQIPYAETRNYLKRVMYSWKHFRWFPQLWAIN